MRRTSFEEATFIAAYGFALRSTCLRRAVGAILVDNNRNILSTGYNGVARGVVHCLDVACPGAEADSGKDLDQCHAIHAEQNAIAHCSNIERAYEIYCTTMPCMSCMKALLATPVQQIFYIESYDSGASKQLWESAGREITQYVSKSTILAQLRLETTNRFS